MALDFFSTISADDAFDIALLSGGGAAFCFWLWWTGLRRGRLMADTPTSKIRSAAQGFVELTGSAHWLPNERIEGPLTGKTCVWWSYDIDEHRSSGKSSSWVTIDRDVSQALFELEDETASMLVDPTGAKVYATATDTWYGSTRRPTGGPEKGSGGLFRRRYRYQEKRLLVGHDVYALGQFRTATAEAEKFDRNSAVRDWLTELKSDRAELLARYDLDGDGEISVEEWEQARQDAEAAVQQQFSQLSLARGVSTLSKPDDGRDFVLSAKCEQQLGKKLRWQTALGLLGFLVGGGVLVLLATARGWFFPS